MFKIENEPVPEEIYKYDSELKKFVDTLSELEIGQSFVITYSTLPSNLTMAMKAVGHLLERRFKTNKLKDGSGIRVGRIAI